MGVHGRKPEQDEVFRIFVLKHLRKAIGLDLFDSNIAKMGEYRRESEDLMGFELIVTNGTIVSIKIPFGCDSDTCSECTAWTLNNSPCIV
jgi:hypothetical protein